MITPPTSLVEDKADLLTRETAQKLRQMFLAKEEDFTNSLTAVQRDDLFEIVKSAVVANAETLPPDTLLRTRYGTGQVVVQEYLSWWRDLTAEGLRDALAQVDLDAFFDEITFLGHYHFLAESEANALLQGPGTAGSVGMLRYAMKRKVYRGGVPQNVLISGAAEAAIRTAYCKVHGIDFSLEDTIYLAQRTIEALFGDCPMANALDFDPVACGCCLGNGVEDVDDAAPRVRSVEP